MVKVGVSLGLTLCTDPEMRNFARFGCDINEIDLDGDIEAQAEAAVAAITKVTAVANEGLEETITLTLSDLPEGKSAREELGYLTSEFEKLKVNLLPNMVKEIRRLGSKVDGTSEEGGVTDPTENDLRGGDGEEEEANASAE